MSSFKTNATIASFGGRLLKLSHQASTTKCEMNLNLYLPPQTKSSAVPVLIYLSGLTCTGDNCAEKGFFQSSASKHGIAIVYPDTSPRGLKVAGEDDSWDFGTGAGFYVDATKEPYSSGYRMYTYITEELPKALFGSFKELDGSRNPGKYKSVSAFAPIANPINCPWGQKAFKGYFGDDAQDQWKAHDATELVKSYKGPLDILIDVGTADNFYKQKQLLPENFAEAANSSGNDTELRIRFQPEYDHSYYFISTFAADHVEHAAKYLI